MTTLFTESQFETYLSRGKTARITAREDEFTAAEAYARALIHNYCGQEFIQTTYTDEQKLNRILKHDALMNSYSTIANLEQPTTRVHKLKHRQVQSITSIVTGYRDSTQTTSTIESKYYEHHDWGFILAKGYSCDFFTVTYIAGQASVPQDIFDVALGLAKRYHIHEDRPSGAISSMSSDGVSYTFITANWNKGRPTGNDYWDAVLNSHKVSGQKSAFEVG